MVVIDLWPSQRDASEMAGVQPLAKAALAKVRRRPWKVVSGRSPAARAGFMGLIGPIWKDGLIAGTFVAALAIAAG
jgi:hypothetical protein